MSESDDGWWGWIKSTKDKVVNQSAEVLEFVKKDIEEFSKVISEEASGVVSSTATTIKDKLQLDNESSSASQMKQSVSGFLSHVAEVFTPSPDDDDQEAIMIWNQQPVTLDRLQASIYAFCSSPSNLVKDPENEEAYEAWLQNFQIEKHEKELANILLENPPLNSCYSTLVPAQLSHSVFWHHYFYELQRLEKAEQRRQEMKKRAQSTEEVNIMWEEEEESNGEEVVLSEQQQTRLLEDYENEIKEEKESTEEEAKEGDENVDRGHKGQGKENTKREDRSKSSTPSSKDTEEDWEKIDAESQHSSAGTPVESKQPKSEDWETWE